jgi:hypothetical protein
VHLLPRRLHQAILRAFGLGFFAQTENLNLLATKDIEKMLNNTPSPRHPHIRHKFLYNKLLGMKANIILFAEH